MRIMVNGNAMDVEEGLSLQRLLERLEIRREYTAVALNREVAPRASYGRTLLRDGDRVEIVHPMGGG